MAFIAGDSIYVMSLSDRRTRPLAGGIEFEARAARKQLVRSPDSRFLLFRRGTPPRMNYAVVEVASGAIVRVLPDSMVGRLRTVENLFTGEPAWSPTSDRIAFLAGPVDEFGPVSVVYIAARNGRGGWTVRLLERDGLEKTALGWTTGHLAWASRRRDGSTTITVANVSGDSIKPGAPIPSGNVRITGLLPAPDGLKFLVTRAGSAPHVLDTSTEPRLIPSALPPEDRLDSYIGWLDDRRLLTFRYPTTWKSELVIADVESGATTSILAKDAMLTGGTLAPATGGVRVVFSEEDGSHPQWYRSLIVTSGEPVTDEGSVTPQHLQLPPDPWSTRIVSWRSEDGTAREAQLLAPAIKTVELPPTVIVPYGGYRNTALTHTYFIDVLLRSLLKDGWQMIRPNTSAADVLRQTSGYGAVQLTDTHSLMDALATQGIVDPGRVAVVGRSHGASLAYYYATHSRVFCGVVAVNGRADWVMQARYDADGLLPRPMGATPDEDPALYAAASPPAERERG